MIKFMHIVFIITLSSALSAWGAVLSDAEIRQGVLRYMTPRCGGGDAKADDIPRSELADYVSINGDTNRLSRILSEIVHTNNAWYSEMAMRELARYGNSEQLPFFCSCATNPALGKIAVEAVLRIEGVTSNSLEIVHEYLFQTNQFPFANIGDRTYLCHDLVGKVFSDSSLNGYRSRVLEMALDFETNVNIAPNLVDMAIVSADPGYRHSKRRLAVLRAAKQRLDYDAQLIVPSNYEVERRIDVYNFQTNYLINAINELVAYPEVNLPD